MTYFNTDRPDFHWLNEDSRLFLQRGYLLEGTTALDRIRFIAEHAERKLALKAMPINSITIWQEATSRFLRQFGQTLA